MKLSGSLLNNMPECVFARECISEHMNADSEPVTVAPVRLGTLYPRWVAFIHFFVEKELATE